MLMERPCSDCKTDLQCMEFRFEVLKNKVTSLLDFYRRSVMLNFPYNPITPELRSLKRYQARLSRHRKSRDYTLLAWGC